MIAGPGPYARSTTRHERLDPGWSALHLSGEPRPPSRHCEPRRGEAIPCGVPSLAGFRHGPSGPSRQWLRRLAPCNDGERAGAPQEPPWKTGKPGANLKPNRDILGRRHPDRSGVVESRRTCMTSRRFAFGLVRLALSAGLLATFVPAVDARMGEPPLSHSAALQPLDLVAVLELEPVDRNALLAEDEAAKATSSAKPLRYASPVDMELSAATAGTWQLLPDGGRVWRLRVHAPGATDLNFGFSRFRPRPRGDASHLERGPRLLPGAVHRRRRLPRRRLLDPGRSRAIGSWSSFRNRPAPRPRPSWSSAGSAAATATCSGSRRHRAPRPRRATSTPSARRATPGATRSAASRGYSIGGTASAPAR